MVIGIVSFYKRGQFHLQPTNLLKYSLNQVLTFCANNYNQRLPQPYQRPYILTSVHGYVSCLKIAVSHEIIHKDFDDQENSLKITITGKLVVKFMIV